MDTRLLNLLLLVNLATICRGHGALLRVVAPSQLLRVVDLSGTFTLNVLQYILEMSTASLAGVPL